MSRLSATILALCVCFWAVDSAAWHDETHLAVARAAGYAKWYNATGADMAKLKAGRTEQHNHYVNNRTGTVVTAEAVLRQAGRYNTIEPRGHLYGAILASVRDYMGAKAEGKYGEYHLGFAAHYLGDLSMPLHNTEYDAFNRKNHAKIDGMVDAGILERPGRIETYPVTVRSEADLAREVARVANLARELGERIRAEKRLPTEEEAYAQLGHSASLLKAVIVYTEAPRLAPRG
ncbi:hypothetical protein [uncultured Desulfuromonas sp.]|uniref:hypothetical protein n=1 Tax=uncultured Desulfuromonas sp. TaxID=181013 RepID=UPI0026154F50|nr:hypothetical protein [uncultured Desulfuromonas sp.]